MPQLHIKAKYERPTLAQRVDRLTNAAEPRLTDRCNALVDRLIGMAQANMDSITPGDTSEADQIAVYRDSLHRADAGKEFPRRKQARGSLRPVSLATTRPGAAFSAAAIEFGIGRPTQYRPLAKAVYELGGRVL